MAPRRWSHGHVVAIVEAVCAIAAAGYLVVIGVSAELEGTAGRSVFDRAFPFLAAVVVLALLGRWAVRSWRAAERERTRPEQPDRRQTGEPGPDRSEPGRPEPDGPGPDMGDRPTTRPALSDPGRDAVARVVAILADAGVFRPQVPDPRLLEQAVADQGEPVTVQAVLAALHEADYWNPGFRFDDHTAALAFHDSHVEQDPGSVRHQIDDLARLAGGDVRITSGDVDVEWVDGVRAARTRVTLTVGGERLALDYLGAAKQLSTVIPVAVARTLRGLPDGKGPPGRLAWLWSDQGVWFTALPAAFDLERLDDDLRDLLEAGAGWEWVDEQEAFAAGDE